MEKRNQKNKEKGNGEGTIYKSGKTGLYVGQYVENGKRHSVYQKKNEKSSEFKKRFNDILAKINNGTYISQKSISLYEILKDYIDNKYKMGITSDRTYIRNKEILKLLKKCCINFIDKPIQKVTVSDIKKSLPNFVELQCKSKDKEIVYKSFSQSVINKEYALLLKGFKIAVSDRIILYNIMDNESIKKPKTKKETAKVTALTIEEEKKLINILNEQEYKYKNIILLALYTGMRIGEILALSYDDIDFVNSTITIKRTLTRDKNDKTIIGNTTKTKNGIRTIYLSKNAIKIVNTLSKQNNLRNINNLIFFDYNKNDFISPNQVNCFLKRLNNKYKFCNHIHTHMLRHTFATRCIEAGMSAKVLQKILGHSDIKITLNTYTDVFEKFNIDENEKYNNYMENLGF